MFPFKLGICSPAPVSRIVKEKVYPARVSANHAVSRGNSKLKFTTVPRCALTAIAGQRRVAPVSVRSWHSRTTSVSCRRQSQIIQRQQLDVEPQLPDNEMVAPALVPVNINDQLALFPFPNTICVTCALAVPAITEGGEAALISQICFCIKFPFLKKLWIPCPVTAWRYSNSNVFVRLWRIRHQRRL